jgi:hypothetical protein
VELPDGITRRQALQGGAALAIGAAVVGGGTSLLRARSGTAARSSSSLAGTDPLVAAMHVHAGYSEGGSSWAQHYATCAAVGVDVMWQTDHDFRARALDYVGTLGGTFVGSTTGAVGTHSASLGDDGSIRVMVESAGSTIAAQSLTMESQVTAVNFFRTGIDGQTLTCVFGPARLAPGAHFEIVLTLSIHPSTGGRPAGQYAVRYRFLAGTTRARFTEQDGLVGVVRAPLPAAGTTITLDPQADIAALWPDMVAIDHGSVLLAFVATSPRRGALADVVLQSVTVDRVRHDALGVFSAQRYLAETYSAKYGVTGYAAEEVSLRAAQVPHCNVFGSPPEYALKDGVTPANWPAHYRELIARVHAAGGVVSWNHPFGSGEGPLLSPVERSKARRALFTERLADGFLGADILEVGYALRGNVPIDTHLELWDTFSRHGRFLTGNGVSDDHWGQHWSSIRNGFLTGLWAHSRAEKDLTGALASGRAYLFHPGHTPGLHLDTLVDDAVPMGAVSVRGAGSRQVAIGVAALPPDCTLELLTGPVDFTGIDPKVSTVHSWTGSAVSPRGTGTVSAEVSTSSDCFVRAQVRKAGAIVASGNPTWLLRRPPEGGIPRSRAT